VAKVYLNETLVGVGEVDSVPAGTSSFSGATTEVIPVTLVAPTAASPGDILSLLVMVRNACSGSSQTSGKARLWYDGRDASSRVSATIGSAALDYFLRRRLQLATTGGTSRTYVEAPVGAPCATLYQLGDWAISLP